MRRTLIALTTCLAILVGATVATAQTAKPTQTTTSTTQTSSSTQGAFSKLSPGNQKIAQALYDAQIKPSGTTSGMTTSTSSSTTQPKTYTMDQIAAMKQHTGWGEIFKQMKANGQIPPHVKNLGQLVSGKYQSQSGTSGGTTITNGRGRSEVVGNSGKPNAGRSGNGHFDDAASTGSQGAQSGDNSGRGSLSSGSGRGYGYGQGGSSGSSASSGGPGNSSHGGGRGK